MDSYDKYKNKKLFLHLEIRASYFKDRTVVLLLELLLLSLLEKIDIDLYLNISLTHKENVSYNFFEYSYINSLNRTFTKSSDYCDNYYSYRGLGPHVGKNKNDLSFPILNSSNMFYTS